MNSSPTIASLALRALIISQLQRTTQNRQEAWKKNNSNIHFENNHSPEETNQQHQLFHLSRTKDITLIGYGSAIALKLEKILGRPSAEIAAQMATHLVSPIKNSCNILQHLSLDRVWQNTQIYATPQRWLQFTLSDTGLAFWLQSLIDLPFQNDLSQLDSNFSTDKKNQQNCNLSFRESTALFRIQHTYSRCGTLLRLCDRESLVQLIPHPISQATWKIAHPSPLPWLNADSRLRLNHPTEQALISQLVTVLDGLAEMTERTEGRFSTPQAALSAYFKLAESLSESFLSFYAACRLLGAVKAIDLPLAQARVGLVLASQIVLKHLLEVELRVVAPPEL